MLHRRGDLVKTAECRNFVPLSVRMEQDYEILAPEGRIGFGWETQDLHPMGACGNAADADAARGKILVEHFAARFVKALQEIDRYPLSNIVSR